MALVLRDVTQAMRFTDAVWLGDPTPVDDFTINADLLALSWAEVAYVDDLAILLTAPDNDQLIAMAEHSLCAIYGAASKRGLDLTYGAGKTELLMAWRGRRTRHFKEKVASNGRKWVVHDDATETLLTVPIVMAYKHLGTWIHNDASQTFARHSRLHHCCSQSVGPIMQTLPSQKGSCLEHQDPGLQCVSHEQVFVQCSYMELAHR